MTLVLLVVLVLVVVAEYRHGRTTHWQPKPDSDGEAQAVVPVLLLLFTGQAQAIRIHTWASESGLSQAKEPPTRRAAARPAENVTRRRHDLLEGRAWHARVNLRRLNRFPIN